MDVGNVIFFALGLLGLVWVVVVLVRRDRMNRRLSERHGPEYSDHQTAAHAAAHAAHLGRGGGWPQG